MKNGIVFSIEEINNGIKIFLKGCPLNCPWCSYPESQLLEKEILRRNSLCIKCVSGSATTCRRSASTCPTGALKKCGELMTTEEVLNEIPKKGNLILSGGEPLYQIDFAFDILNNAKSLCIDTTVETSGNLPTLNIKKVVNYVDTFIFDLKIMDKKKAKQIFNGNIQQIKSNFDLLLQLNKKVIPRIPLIPQYTYDIHNLEDIMNFINNRVEEVILVPFNKNGIEKYKALKREYLLKNISPLNKDKIDEILNLFISNEYEILEVSLML